MHQEQSLEVLLTGRHQKESAKEEGASQIPTRIKTDSSFDSARGKGILIEEKECKESWKCTSVSNERYLTWIWMLVAGFHNHLLQIGFTIAN
jgi:hypothetical protein